ncbi:MAG: hypothetical protein R2861_06640 [Desulfobacterales bacterium]
MSTLNAPPPDDAARHLKSLTTGPRKTTARPHAIPRLFSEETQPPLAMYDPIIRAASKRYRSRPDLIKAVIFASLPPKPMPYLEKAPED